MKPNFPETGSVCPSPRVILGLIREKAGLIILDSPVSSLFWRIGDRSIAGKKTKLAQLEAGSFPGLPVIPATGKTPVSDPDRIP